MLVPVKWLKEYVNLDGIDLKTLEDRLVMTGSNTETVKDLANQAKGVVVGHILSIKQHPDADKLVVCQVAIGDGQDIQIVTGAKNMKEKDYVPVALDGAVLADGLEIKSGHLRGQASEGMFCSLQELGFDDKVIPKAFADGLLILDQAYPLGMPIFEAIDLDDHVIEFEITPNRPDCLSMIGMAREAAATFNRDLKLPDTSVQHETGDVHQLAKVTVSDTHLCTRYAARVVEEVTIKPSPQWLQSKLIKAGMRPINNIVDITNFVLLEYGQPIHAFDLDYLEGAQINVRRAKAGESLTTLDDQERKLTEDMLLICDGKKPVAIAGVMGGGNSEVSETTKRLLIEVAHFNKSSIRETSKQLGLRTEASSRYEKGISPAIIPDAMNRVCHLIEQLGAGKVVAGQIDVYPNPYQSETISLRPRRVNAVLGTSLRPQEIATLLETLGCDVTSDHECLRVVPPLYRLDLIKEIDLIEEVARLYGYDQIAETLPTDSETGGLNRRQQMELKIRQALTGMGLNEILTYSFISPKTFDLLNLPSDSPLRQNVVLKNPLGEEYSVMRPTLLGNMMGVMAHNVKRQAEDVRLYEIGNIFIPKALPITEEPIEKRMVIIGMIGQKVDFFALKAHVVSLLEKFKIQGLRFETEKTNATFHPGRTATIHIQGQVLGTLGEIHPLVTDHYEVGKRVYVAELDFELILKYANTDYLYEALPRFPAATRDIAMTLPEHVSHQDVMDCIEKHRDDLLAKADLFDVYQGEQIDQGLKSMAYALAFRAPDRTLTDAMVQSSFDKVVAGLQNDLQATIR